MPDAMTTSVQGWTPPTQTPLPAALAPLLDVAFNLHWSYSPAAWAAFAKLDPARWESTGHNPVRLLAGLSAERLAAAGRDAETVKLVREAVAQHESMLAQAAKGWYSAAVVGKKLPTNLRTVSGRVLFAEFGLTECFQIYSGGLGLLAGDHLKIRR